MPKLIALTVWILLGGLLFYGLQGVMFPNSATRLEQQQNQDKTVVLKRSPDGHYRAEALINGLPVNVMIDTGATGVAISQSLASKLGVSSRNAVQTQTANGTVTAYLARLNTVKLGPIEVHDVSATIAPNLSGDVLLGMAFLDRMDIHLFQGEMHIRYAD